MLAGLATVRSQLWSKGSINSREANWSLLYSHESSHPLLEVFCVEGQGREGMPSTSPHTPLAEGNFICASTASHMIIRDDDR